MAPRAQSYLSYNWPDKPLESAHIPGQNSLFYGVLAGLKCICKPCQYLTWKLRKLLQIIAPEHSGQQAFFY